MELGRVSGVLAQSSSDTVPSAEGEAKHSLLEEDDIITTTAVAMLAVISNSMMILRAVSM